jgi:drug/metabolite transporter (DMT)-like permease
MSRRGWLIFGALGLVWGLPYLFIKIAVADLAPPVIVFGRVFLGALVLIPVAWRSGALAAVRPKLRWIVAFALIEISGPWVLLTFAEQRVSSSLAALFISAVPLVGAVVAWTLRLDDRFDRTRILGLVLGIAGVASLVGLDVRGGSWIAVGAMVLTSIGYAIGPIIVSTRLRDVPSLGVIAVACLTNVVLYAPFAAIAWPASAPASAWGSVLVLGLVCTVGGFVLFFALIAEVGPTRTTVITYVNPAVAVLLGIAVLGEPVTAGILVGFPLVLLGSFLATRRAPAMEDEPVPA